METSQQRLVPQPPGSQESNESFKAQVYSDKNWTEPAADAFKNGGGKRLARGLGWLGIGLGLAEIIAPRTCARILGIRNHGVLFRIMGLREIASGVGILTQRRPAGWLWARVGGDIMDLAVLGRVFGSDSKKPVNVAIATAAITGVTALDLCCAQQLSDGREGADRQVKIKKTILIRRSADELYRQWRDFQNLPRFMKNLESVKITTDSRTRWTAKGPAGKKIQWDAEIVEDNPGERLAWRSLEGADVENSGSVRFDPAMGGRGTLVSVEMQYSAPAGALGKTIAKLFGRAPEQAVEEDLRRFKQMIETGEIITTVGQPAGRPSSTSWKYDRTVRRAAASST